MIDKPPLNIANQHLVSELQSFVNKLQKTLAADCPFAKDLTSTSFTFLLCPTLFLNTMNVFRNFDVLPSFPGVSHLCHHKWIVVKVLGDSRNLMVLPHISQS